MFYDYAFKLIMAGNGGVGKTTMVSRYMSKKFSINLKRTIGIEFQIKDIKVKFKKKKRHCRLQIWDLGGQQRFHFLHPGFINGANGALLLFDISNQNSFEELTHWVDLLRNQDKNLKIILIAAKCDLQHKIDDDKALNLCKNFRLYEYIKASSKSGLNVDKVYENITKALIFDIHNLRKT